MTISIVDDVAEIDYLQYAVQKAGLRQRDRPSQNLRLLADAKIKLTFRTSDK